MIVLCRELNVLPRAGGLLDQDSFFVYMLSAAAEAIGERLKREQKR